MKNRKIVCENIKWDTEENGIEYSPVELDLPEKVTLKYSDFYDGEVDDDFESVVDYLSDNFGWCIYSVDITAC